MHGPDPLLALADGEYYESPDRYVISPQYQDALRALLPEPWQVAREGVWLHAVPPAVDRGTQAPVVQGWKIHVSCTPDRVMRLLPAAVPACVSHGVAFKIAADPRFHYLLNAKGQGRGNSGKFLTAYPPEPQLFAALIEHLHAATAGAGIEGPVILSDRRYKDSRAVFYRYGGFHSPFALNVDGTATPCLVAPSGELVPDRRLPYVEIPAWTDDPLAGPSLPLDDGETLLKGRYAIDGALSFSNSGGVYTGTDTHSATPVVVKEARPLTNLWTRGDWAWDAVCLLRHEFQILAALQHLPFVPRVLDLFEEGEHLFLVEERLDAVTLNTFWTMGHPVFAPHVREPGAIEHFVPRWVHVAARLIDMVRMAHEAGVLLGDVSPRNVLIHPERLDLWFIDFESAVRKDAVEELMSYAANWGTPGFMRPGRASRQCVSEADDYYGLAMVLANAVAPMNDFLALNPNAVDLFLDQFVEMGLPPAVRSVIDRLRVGAVEDARRILDHDAFERGAFNGPSRRRRQPGRPKSAVIAPPPELAPGLEDMIRATAAYTVASADETRVDRLWPAHHQVFATNPLSLAYGASGIVLFLHDALGSMPAPVEAWLNRVPLSVDRYPPGLFVGLAGIAYACLECGLPARGEEALELASRSPLRDNEPGMYLGSAGLGFVNLHFYGKTGDPQYLRRAIEAGERLIVRRESFAGVSGWRHTADGARHFGYGFGSSGIGLFLLYLHQTTGRDDFRGAAVDGLDADLAGREPGDRWDWRRFEGDSLVYPYFIHGAAGIGSIALRFYVALREERYRDLAIRIARNAFVKYSYTPGLFEGLAGVGELMLDVYQVTADETFRSKALDIADTIRWFALERPGGIAFPGRWLDRISTDYATGSAGIGLFLHRLHRCGARRLVDLDVRGAPRTNRDERRVAHPMVAQVTSSLCSARVVPATRARIF